MVEKIRQRITVQAGGRLLLQSAKLRDGESVEVIVMTDQVDASKADERLAAVRELRAHLNLDPARADQWVEDVRSERAETDRPSNPA